MVLVYFLSSFAILHHHLHHHYIYYYNNFSFRGLVKTKTDLPTDMLFIIITILF